MPDSTLKSKKVNIVNIKAENVEERFNQFKNKNHQNLMEEKDKDKDDKLIFNPQIGLGNILFIFRQTDIEKILGTPDENERDLFSQGEYSLSLSYWDLDLTFCIYFENDVFDYLSIHAQDIILNGFRFSLHDQDRILSFIKEYHNIQELEFIEKAEYDRDMEELCYFYENLGLTIWFDESGISDICLQKTV